MNQIIANDRPILKVSGLKTYFFTNEGVIKAVDGVDFEVRKGQILGLVGESGCGKSVTALSILRLVSDPPGRIVNGKIELLGNNLRELSDKEIRKIRGKTISMIFQDPLTSLNPVLTVGYQISEVFRFHKALNRAKSLMGAIHMLKATEIPAPEERVKNYPHEMSGGMRQRAMIAMALACEPALLIADEPTTALDVTIQAQILDLMKKIKDDFNTAILLITHDLGVVSEVCDRVAVMYAGKIVEYADSEALFNNPMHPYTVDLLESIPKITAKKGKKLYTIKGTVPDPHCMPIGCSFYPRCKKVTKRCKENEPKIFYHSEGHQIRCWLYDNSNTKEAR